MSAEITPAFKKAVRTYLEEHPRILDDLAWEYNDYFIESADGQVNGIEAFFQTLHDMGPIDAFEVGQGCPDFDTGAPYFRYDKYADPHSLTEAQAKKLVRERALDDDGFYEEVAYGDFLINKDLKILVERFVSSKNAKSRATGRPPAGRKTASKNSSRQGENMKKTTSARRTATKRTTARHKTTGARR